MIKASAQKNNKIYLLAKFVKVYKILNSHIFLIKFFFLMELFNKIYILILINFQLIK